MPGVTFPLLRKKIWVMKFCKTMLSLGVLFAIWLAAPTLLLAAGTEHGSAADVNPLTVDPDLAIFTAVIFIVLLLFLSKFAWRPLMEGLDRREKSITDRIDAARLSADRAAEKLEQYEAKLAAARAEAEQLIVQARRDASAQGEQLLAAARQQAERERQRALDDIEQAKNRAVQDIARSSADIAFTLARKVIHRELKQEDHAALIREALDQLPSEN